MFNNHIVLFYMSKLNCLPSLRSLAKSNFVGNIYHIRLKHNLVKDWLGDLGAEMVGILSGKK